jgi:hypothetical protein
MECRSDFERSGVGASPSEFLCCGGYRLKFASLREPVYAPTHEPRSELQILYRLAGCPANGFACAPDNPDSAYYFAYFRWWRDVTLRIKPEDTMPATAKALAGFLFYIQERSGKAMVWTYRITAAARPRLIMRLSQIYDQQLLEIDRMSVIRERDVTGVRIEVQCDEYLARRIHAKLYRLSDVAHVELSNAQEGIVSEGDVPSPNGPSQFDPLAPQP